MVGGFYVHYAVYARRADLEGHDGEGFGAGGFNSGLPHHEPGEASFLSGVEVICYCTSPPLCAIQPFPTGFQVLY